MSKKSFLSRIDSNLSLTNGGIKPNVRLFLWVLNLFWHFRGLFNIYGRCNGKSLQTECNTVYETFLCIIKPTLKKRDGLISHTVTN